MFQIMTNQKDQVAVFWFRRDLRLEDNVGLSKALKSGHPVVPIFIFDDEILNELDSNDPRVSFIHERLKEIHQKLTRHQSGLFMFNGNPLDVFKTLMKDWEIATVYSNHDYEPYGRYRDEKINELLQSKKIPFNTFKDQVMVEKNEVVKADGSPYTVYTPFKNRWLQHIHLNEVKPMENPGKPNWYKTAGASLSLAEIGFEKSNIEVKPFNIDDLSGYAQNRDLPAVDKTSYLSPHLRFGTIGIRTILSEVKDNAVFVSELIWREFFMQILYHFPSVVEHNFKRKYDSIEWRNDRSEFEKWCSGNTGYPMVDAGMRQLNATGYMHNRVRMVTASFLCKHLLIDWRWGEAYFASKLLDFELASNNGNWQWAAGTGCDAAPYFRIFNPIEQLRKFDGQWQYVAKWIPEVSTEKYPNPMVDHKLARIRALETYKRGLG